jgi:hypothetical protein
MAYSVMWINLLCLRDGKFPNGQKLKQSDVEGANQKIEESKLILDEHGIEYPILEVESKPQLTLF